MHPSWSRATADLWWSLVDARGLGRKLHPACALFFRGGQAERSELTAEEIDAKAQVLLVESDRLQERRRQLQGCKINNVRLAGVSSAALATLAAVEDARASSPINEERARCRRCASFIPSSFVGIIRDSNSFAAKLSIKCVGAHRVGKAPNSIVPQARLAS